MPRLPASCPSSKYKQDWDKMGTEVASSNPVIHFTRVPLEELFPDETERRYANLVLEACQDGPKEHTEVIHVDPTYRINLSTQIQEERLFKVRFAILI
jgi:hypothetical protein